MSRLIALELKKLGNLLKRKHLPIESACEGSRLTSAHGKIIGFLYRKNQSDIYQKDIEKEFTLRRSSATALLKTLEEDGFIERKAVVADGRLKKLTLTDKGRVFRERFVQGINQLEAEMTSGLTQDEIESFLITIDKIRNNLMQ
ncbi:MAG: MarR family transcriptional regulator [Clostridia bacterium]